MCCVASLSLSRWIWKGWREQSILPGGNIYAVDAPPCGWCVTGRVAVPLALWLFCLPVVQEERCEAAIAMWCWEDPSPLNFDFFFFQVCLLLYGRLAHSAMLVLAILVNLLTESQEVSISFTDVTEHVNTSLHNKFSTVAIWEPQTKALRSQNDSSAEPRQPLVQVQVLSAKEYCFCSSFWYLSKRNQWHLQKLQSYVAHGFSQNTNIIIKPLWPWQFVFLKL